MTTALTRETGTAAPEPPEIIEVEHATVSCDGGGGPLGHPKVYLSLERSGVIECPYCGRRFVRKKGARGGGH
ncbi:MAG: zinc-finger domain-containing protein [Alphaproteobacteria bacterium]|nr:zinc-finger domain-containing protein [Alphaproteobacteria bacterium]